MRVDPDSVDHSGNQSCSLYTASLAICTHGPSLTPSGQGPDESPYAAVVRALLEDGPMQGKTVEVEAVEGRPPKTIDVPDEKGGACRYCLAEWTQEGMTAAYTFLYAV
jgi:hypothetical protein